MLTSILSRASALALGLTFVASCASTNPPRPSQAGDWHWEGGSSALFSMTDGGDFGDTDVFSVDVAGGRFATDQLLIEGIASASDTQFEDSAGDEINTSTMEIGVGARFYPSPDGSSRPYIGLRTGMNVFDINDDIAATDETDTSPFVEARLGLEAFVSSCAAVDMGFSWKQIFSRDLGPTEDDVSNLALFVGFSIWL
ncbi:MAG: hypothetical protein ACKVXR_06680 [Planctomycetota bacterium]